MTSVQGHGFLYRERFSVALPDFSPPPKSEFSKQSAEPSGSKPPVTVISATDVPKSSEHDLQRIFKTVLKAQAPAPAPALAFAISKVPRDKLKACSPDVYCGKFHMDCYKFCQQCEDYFATAEDLGPTQILFATSILWNQISFRWQQYKQKRDAESSVPVMWDEIKAFFCQSLGDSQAFVDTYWGKMRKDSQHQLEEVFDSAVHLEHLQAVVREFDPVATLNEEIMIRYFREGLRAFIRVQLDVQGRELDSWEEAVEKTVNVEAKVLLQSASSTREIDQRCPRGNHLAYTNVAKLQVSTQDPRDESSTFSAWHPQDEPLRSSHPHPSRSESGETFEKSFYKEKKKQHQLDHK